MSELQRVLLAILAATLVPACGGGGGGGGGAAGGGVDTDVIAGPGGLTINTVGGAAGGGNGGAGGEIRVRGASGSDVRVLGGALSVDASFTVPSITPYLGLNPHVASTGTVDLSLTGSVLMGTVDPAAPATGLHVPLGVTLTLSDLGSDVNLTLTNGVHIQGTLVLAEESGVSLTCMDLDLDCSNLVVAATGSILMVGTPSAVFLENAGGGGGLAVNAAGTVILAGTITTSGGDNSGGAASAGGAGNVLVKSMGSVYHTGTITATGGAATAVLTNAGSGGTISLESSHNLFGHDGAQSGVFNSGSLNSSAGAHTGPSGGPGAGGTISLRTDLSANDGSRIVSSGNLTSSGGSSPSTGGNGGGITLRCASGPIRLKGTLTTTGGAGAAGLGGIGGGVVIQQLGDGEGPSGHLGTEFAPVRGGISVAANLHTAGGASAAGGNGGAGGTILITQSATDSFTDTPPGLNPISVVGLLSMTSTGGAGSADGGAAGVVEIRNFKMLDTTLNPNDGIDVFFVGAVHNEVPLIALGGNATAGTGGAGGQLIISGDSVVNLDSPKGRTSTNTAALDCRGGDGVAGGDGGFIGIESTFRTTNSGSMICSGGSATSGDGGRAGQVNLGSIMHLVNSGDITANGGDSLTGTGGGAFGVYLWGSDWWGGDSAEGSATNSGAIVSSGGAGAVGGNADDIFVVDHYSVRNSGPLTGNGGNGSAGDGGLAATIYLLSDDALNSSGAITALGGGGTGAGSVGRNGGQVLIAGGPSVRHAGGITATGGAAELGGDGGQIRFNSVGGFSTVGGTMNVFRGAGAPAANNGVTGNVFRDGVEAPLSALGTVTF